MGKLKAWQNEEKRISTILSGSHIPSSKPFDVETAQYVVEVKYRQNVGVSEVLKDLERLKRISEKLDKIGLVVIRKKHIRNEKVSRLVCLLFEDFLEIIKDERKEILLKVFQVQ